jgi:hypothetical protein
MQCSFRVAKTAEEWGGAGEEECIYLFFILLITKHKIITHTIKNPFPAKPRKKP